MWQYIKPVAGHLGADYGMQSAEMAVNKNHCIKWRLKHVAIITLSHILVAVTSQASRKSQAEYVAFNVVTHFAADSLVLPKWIDQLIHISAALYSGWRWLKGGDASQ